LLRRTHERPSFGQTRLRFELTSFGDGLEDGAGRHARGIGQKRALAKTLRHSLAESVDLELRLPVARGIAERGWKVVAVEGVTHAFEERACRRRQRRDLD